MLHAPEVRGGGRRASGSAPERPSIRAGVRFTFQAGVVPRTLGGRIAAGLFLLTMLGACAAAVLVVRSFLLHHDLLTLRDSSSIGIVGNGHLTRPQLLSVFGEDIERNIFQTPLAERRAELEQLPWVQHATIMRLLPGKLRIAIVERRPVAFAREGGHIGLVDGTGVLLDMAGAAPEKATGLDHYSFPVVTGILAQDPLSVRAARMKIFARFQAGLDSSGEKISQRLSEVDLSNPEDVKALIPDEADSTKGAEVLVHFGDDHFLERYRKFEENLPKWRTGYPKLASADMRYERQVVLEMQAGAPVPTGAPTAGAGGGASPAPGVKKTGPHIPSPVVPFPAKAAGPLPTTPGKSAPARGTSLPATAASLPEPKPASAAGASPPVVRGTIPGSPSTILTESFDVPRKPSPRPVVARPVSPGPTFVPEGWNEGQQVPR